MNNSFKQFSGPEDIYKELVEDAPEDEEWLLGLMAFAIIEEQKIEWMRHESSTTGQYPTDQQIKQWYQQQSPGVLLRAKDTANSRITNYGSNVISAYLEEYEEEIKEEIIVNEIRETKKFWPQFGLNIASSFVSSLVFALLLILFAFIVFNDKSPIDIGKQFSNNPEEPENVKD